MTNPMFVETSKGYINLIQVRVIEQHEHVVRFNFSGSEHIDLPKREGEKILTRMVYMMLEEA
jgi:hypothetical protein